MSNETVRRWIGPLDGTGLGSYILAGLIGAVLAVVYLAVVNRAHTKFTAPANQETTTATTASPQQTSTTQAQPTATPTPQPQQAETPLSDKAQNTATGNTLSDPDGYTPPPGYTTYGEPIQPKIELLFEGAARSTISGDVRTKARIEINVLVRNNSDDTITNVRVEIEELKISGETFHKIPLPRMNDTPPYEKEHTLGPKSEMYFTVLERMTGAPIMFRSIERELPPDVLPDPKHEFVVTARAGNAPPSSATMKTSPGRYHTVIVELQRKR